jgi:hypothetical protein
MLIRMDYPIAYANQVGQPQEAGQVTREIIRQQGAIDRLHETISGLEQRTTPIRLGRPEASGAQAVPPREVLTDLANEIALRTDSIEAATSRLVGILHELEL